MGLRKRKIVLGLAFFILMMISADDMQNPLSNYLLKASFLMLLLGLLHVLSGQNIKTQNNNDN